MSSSNVTLRIAPFATKTGNSIYDIGTDQLKTSILLTTHTTVEALVTLCVSVTCSDLAAAIFYPSPKQQMWPAEAKNAIKLLQTAYMV